MLFDDEQPEESELKVNFAPVQGTPSEKMCKPTEVT